MTVIEARDRLNELIAEGRGNLPLRTFNCQWAEGEITWEEIEGIRFDEGDDGVDILP